MVVFQTVVETHLFIRQAQAIMSDKERTGIVSFLAANPMAGVSLGGGLRKVRIPRAGGGKSGGYRTIFVFGGEMMPVVLVSVFAKNVKDNLSHAELAQLLALSKTLIAHYGARQ